MKPLLSSQSNWFLGTSALPVTPAGALPSPLCKYSCDCHSPVGLHSLSQQSQKTWTAATSSPADRRMPNTTRTGEKGRCYVQSTTWHSPPTGGKVRIKTLQQMYTRVFVLASVQMVYNDICSLLLFTVRSYCKKMYNFYWNSLY